MPEQGPVRTCVGCRRRDSRSSLLRVVVTTEGAGVPVLVPDEAARMPGRGAWVHPDLDCLRLAERRAAFGRALRHAGPFDTEALHVAVVARARTQEQDGPSTRTEPR